MYRIDILCQINDYTICYSISRNHHYLGSTENGGYRILNGNRSRVLPYQVALSGCGGALIEDGWVLTAKHCLGRKGIGQNGKNWKSKGFTPFPKVVWAGINLKSNLQKRRIGQRRQVPATSMLLDPSAGEYITN